MPKASPPRASFNAGEISVLMEGRIDIDVYGATMREMRNYVAAPQGPAIGRSGTYFQTTVYDEDKYSALIPFVFSDDQALMLEFCDERVRFHRAAGMQTWNPKAITAVVTASPFVVTSALLDANVGDEVVLSGWPLTQQLNGATAKITAKSGNNYTLSGVTYTGATGAISDAVGAVVYHIVSPYDHMDVRKITALQSVDVVYLFCSGYRVYTLSRRGAYDWTFAQELFDNGPFANEGLNMGTLKPSQTGNAVPFMTADNAPAPFVASGTAYSANANFTPFKAFDSNTNSRFISNNPQNATLQIDLGSARVIDGYVIYKGANTVRGDPDDESFSSTDAAPGDWRMEGSNDDTNWDTLDTQTSYILYDNGRSVFFETKNTTAYRYYRLVITSCTRNGELRPRVGGWTLRPADEAGRTITFTLSGNYSDVNDGAGFLPTDVDRLIRVKASDNNWRVMRIKTVTSATVIQAVNTDEPLPTRAQITNWQLGIFSDTLGWPETGDFFEDRLWLSGVAGEPDGFYGSRTGDYENFEQRNGVNEVLDDSAIYARLNSRKLSKILWMRSDEMGLIASSGTGAFVITSASTNTAITPRSIRARASTERGAAAMDPVKVDRQILFVQKGKRTLRELAYVEAAGGYKSPSMSKLASHLGIPQFEQMAYAQEPYSIVWFRREDGSVVALTYDRDEDVIGWHRHNFGAQCESLAVIPFGDGNQDEVWFVFKRVVNGVTRKFIERLMPFWDFDSTLATAHFVDCGLRYNGAPVSSIYAYHLNGATVNGLADGRVFRGLTFVNGKLDLPGPASNVVVGLPYEQHAEISRIEAGAPPGFTALGKTKRVNDVTLQLWQSAGGEVAIWNEDIGDFEWVAIEYPIDVEAYDEQVKLQSLMTQRIPLPPHHGLRGTISFRQTDPLPLNVISIIPDLNVNV